MKLENLKKAYIEALNSVQATLEVAANNINAFYHKIKEEGEVEDTVWDYTQTCVLVCKDVHAVLSKIYEHENNIEVSYISFEKKSNEMRSCMIAYTSKSRETPSILMKEKLRDLIMLYGGESRQDCYSEK